MPTEKELQNMLKAAVSGNISKWCKENGLKSQRANVSEMMAGYRKISEKVAKKIDKRLVRGWVKKTD